MTSQQGELCFLSSPSLGELVSLELYSHENMTCILPENVDKNPRHSTCVRVLLYSIISSSSSSDVGDCKSPHRYNRANTTTYTESQAM